MKYDTLLFDADDTLLDFKRAERSALTDTLKEYGLPCDENIISEYSKINVSLWKMLELGQIEKSRLRTKRFEMLCEKYSFSANASDMAITYTDRLSEKPFTIGGAADVCRKLSEKHKMYLVTNGIKSVQSKRFAESGLAPFFIRSFISEDVGYEKPSVKYFEYVAASIPGFDKSRTLIIGDSLSSDIKGGNLFGIDTCFYNPLYNDIPCEIKVNYNIQSLYELEKILLTEA